MLCRSVRDTQRKNGHDGETRRGTFRGQICSTIASWHQFTEPEEVRKKKKAELMATKSLAAQAAEGEPPSIFLQLQSLAMKEHKVGRDHLDLCRTLDKLVEAYLDEDRPADAIAAMDRMLQITTKAYGVVHMETAKVTNNLAQVMDAPKSQLQVSHTTNI